MFNVLVCAQTSGRVLVLIEFDMKKPPKQLPLGVGSKLNLHKGEFLHIVSF